MLGVAFISGVEMLSDTIQRSADELIDSSLSTNGSVVRSTSTQQSAGAIVRQTVPNELLDQVRSIPGVRTAEGAVQGFGRLIGDDNEPVDPGPVPTFIFNWVDDPALATGRLKDGRPPEADDEIVIDARTAADENWALGDEVRMQSSAGVRSFTVTGIGSLGGGDTSTGVRLVMLDTETAQVFTGSDGQYSYILVAPTDGVSPDSLTDALTAGLPPGVEAITGAAFVEETSNQASQSLVLITRFCQAFGVIGLIVAGLTIANTFSILVAQRTRELALLRVAGASSRQIVWSVVTEAAIIGVVGSVIGLATGVGGAWLAKNAIAKIFTIDAAMPAISVWTIAWGLALGTITTVIAAAVPALRSGRIPPIAALGETSADVTGVSLARKVSGTLVLASGVVGTVAALLRPDLPNRLAVFGVGAGLLIIATVLVGPMICGPAIWLLGAPFRAVSHLGRLAVADVMRHPKRTTATATAMAVGVALVAMVTLLANSIEGTATDTFKTKVSADVVVDGGLANPLAGGMPESVAFAVSELPGVDKMSRFRMVPAQVYDASLTGFTGDQLVAGIDMPDFFSLVDMQISAGSVGLLGTDAVAVSSASARNQGWELGDEISISYPQLGARSYRIGMIYDTQLPLVSVLLPMAAIDEVSSIALRQDSQIYVTATPGTSVNSLITSIDTTLDELSPSASAKRVDAWVDSGIDQLNGATNLVYALLAFAIFLSLFGIVNTLSLSMTERTKELALMRAVGITRAQLIRQVIFEGSLISSYGTVLGLVTGLWIGGGLIAIGQNATSIALNVPVLKLAVLAVGGVVSGMIAAVLPAIRASRLPIQQTIARG